MIEAIPKKEPKTTGWIIDILRGLLETAHNREVSEFYYTAVIDGEMVEFGSKAKNVDIMACRECDSDKFNMAPNGQNVDIICAECKLPYSVIYPR